MSESGNVDLFKSRLAQLKKVLERDGKIAENLFFAALQLEKNKDLKSDVQAIIDKHKLKAKKGYLVFEEVKDRPAAVKALLKDSFEFLLKAFSVEKSALVQRKVPEPTGKALQLFEMQSTLESQAASQAHAFESTMKDLDSIDTSTPLEQTVIVPPPSDGESEKDHEPSPQKLTVPRVTPAVPKPPVQPIAVSKIAIAEHVSGEKLPASKSPVVVLSPTGSPVQKTIPLPPKTPPEHAPAVAKVVPTSPPAPKPIANAKPVPAQAPAPVPSSLSPVPVSYEYYVCNRCGEETSKSAIRQIGTFLECPKCKFHFSRAEATTIQKAPPASEKTTYPGQEEGKKPFDIYSNKLPGEDESLIRPSALFGDREKEAPVEKSSRPAGIVKEKEKDTVSPAKRLVPVAKGPELNRPKPRPVPTDRLVRPSEFLGLKEEKPASEVDKIVQNEASEYYSEESPGETPAPPAKQIAEKIAQSSASEYFEEGVVPALTDKPMPKAAKPAPSTEPSRQETTPVHEESPAPGDACPKCGSIKYSRIQDRNKVVSYNPLLYGTKKKCTMCLFEFD